MSARRKKRTNQNSSPEVLDVQERQVEPTVPEEVPQQESEGNPQEDTTVREEITKTKEATMGFRDRLNLDRESIIKIAMGVGVSVCIAMVLMFTLMTPKGTHSADMTRMEQGITTMGSQIANYDSDITDLQDDTEDLQNQYEGIGPAIVEQTQDIDALTGRVATAEGHIVTMATQLATVGSPPEGYLTGNFTSGNLTLHAKASDAGNHTANVHLVFSPPINAGNATTYDEALNVFKVTVNWTAANVKPYIPVASYNGTDWGISQVWWNIGTFALAADNVTDVGVLYGGLNTTPSFAYAEIYPVLK